MTIRISNINISIEDDSELKTIASKELKVDPKEIKSVQITKQSIDARKKANIKLVYTLDVNLHSDEKRLAAKLKSKDVTLVEKEQEESLVMGDKELSSSPVVIGTGPAGIFCGLTLARYGYRPIILERGQDVDTRTKDVHHFWEGKGFSPKSNVQFGEGGAGTFSDGKLTTRIKKERRSHVMLEELVKAGAPEEIMYSGKPHIGTDILKEVVKNIRHTIISLGGEVRFDSLVTDVIIKDSKLQGLIVNGDTEIDCEAAIFAIGHSARDTYQMLYDRGADMILKPFSIGVRIEHPQMLIDKSQYGEFGGHKKLGAADYQLVFKSNKTGRTAYSFCMCPGGLVVASSSEEGGVVTNGMSEYKRDRENANSAFVVSVEPGDYGSDHPLGGVEFQRKWETLAFKHGGGDYHAPAQLLEDFIKNRPSKKLGSVNPSYRPGVVPTDIRQCLPQYVTDTMVDALDDFDRKIKGFKMGDALLTGVETRTSAPLRIVRDETYQSTSIKGLYPAGEGAGYAGGIVSAGVDGIKVAEEIIKKYRPV
jgi:uncharacterized protein